MKIAGIGLPFLLTAGVGQAENYKCPTEAGKWIYQNWPCGEKPKIERKAPERPNHAATVKCGMVMGAANMIKRLAGESTPVDLDNCVKKSK